MSTSLQYSAVRGLALTPEEEVTVHRVLEERNATFPYDAEQLTFDPADGSETILAGSTMLSTRLVEVVPSIRHWLAALSDVARAVPGAVWWVSIEGTPIDWDETRGFWIPGMDDPELDGLLP